MMINGIVQALEIIALGKSLEGVMGRWVVLVLDDFNREGPGARMIRSQDQIIEWDGKPAAIGYDNGLEYISGAMQ